MHYGRFKKCAKIKLLQDLKSNFLDPEWRSWSGDLKKFDLHIFKNFKISKIQKFKIPGSSWKFLEVLRFLLHMSKCPKKPYFFYKKLETLLLIPVCSNFFTVISLEKYGEMWCFLYFAANLIDFIPPLYLNCIYYE